MKLRWRKSTTVSWRCYQYGKQFRTVYCCCTFLPTATATETITAAAATTANQQPQQYCINENQNCDDEDLDETSSKSHLSFPLLLHALFSAINQCK